MPGAPWSVAECVRPGRPIPSGKFLRIGGERFLVRGVAYGSFAPRADGHQFPESNRVERDFNLMRLGGINTVRTYTVPPPDVLDVAAANGLRVMAGVTWPQHVAFLDSRSQRGSIIRAIGDQLRSIASHPALLLTAIGNEIPPGIVRWHGRRRVEQFLRAAFDEARNAAPDVLLTYVNYPPTEFLELPFLDVHAFNVYLHDEAALRAYVARLHHIAADRPLLLTECGADSQRQTEHGQAGLAAMQVRVAFSEGACGAIVFTWTDEWWRGGASVEDWSFGLVDRRRHPKPAYAAISRTFESVPFPQHAGKQWPSVSAIVCAYNAADTIDDCLTALQKVDYPSLEIIVVDDGSTDETALRVTRYPGVRLIQIPNGGLSAARNVGLNAATGEVVAYVDADVRVDPSWLMYLAQPFMTTTVVAAGGPNVAPPDDSWFAQCVARAPGAPTHVMFDDRYAEHIPGCNFAARRSALLTIGGFDPIFLRAGDDVDVCWRLQERGGRIAFAHAALVWHHHRARFAAYWRQQVGYGEGEAWLRLRHPDRFWRSGVAWRGRIYSGLPFVRSLTENRLHSGVWGSAAFPTVYTRAHPMQALPHSAEWLIGAVVLLLGGFATFRADGHLIAPVASMALGVTAMGITLVKCALYSLQSDVEGLPTVGRCRPRVSQWIYHLTIGWLHIVQPFARSYGYVRGLLRPPRSSRHEVPVTPVPAPAAPPRLANGYVAFLLGRTGECLFWSETWTSVDALLTRVAERLRAVRLGRGIHVDDGWRADHDISVSVGVWGWIHIGALVEDHGTGRCLFRTRLRVRLRVAIVLLFAIAAVFIALAAVHGFDALAVMVVAGALMFLVKIIYDAARDARWILAVIAATADEFRMQDVSAAASPPRPGASSWTRHLSPPEASHGA